MTSYITQLSNIKKQPKKYFISWRKQNMIIDSLSNYISLQITISVRDAKMFIIYMDSSFNISHKNRYNL